MSFWCGVHCLWHGNNRTSALLLLPWGLHWQYIHKHLDRVLLGFPCSRCRSFLQSHGGSSASFQYLPLFLIRLFARRSTMKFRILLNCCLACFPLLWGTITGVRPICFFNSGSLTSWFQSSPIYQIFCTRKIISWVFPILPMTISFRECYRSLQ